MYTGKLKSRSLCNYTSNKLTEEVIHFAIITACPVLFDGLKVHLVAVQLVQVLDIQFIQLHFLLALRNWNKKSGIGPKPEL